MRKTFTLLHRWVGLAIAAFLLVAGSTGAVISWNEELDERLNPDLTQATQTGPQQAMLDLATRIEQRDPRIRITYLPLAVAPGKALSVFVEPRLDPTTGTPFALDYNQVFVDPVSGAELGRREWGTVWPVTRRTLMSFLYKLHYSLHVPRLWGEERWGLWLMGLVALVWTFDGFVGLYLTLPLRLAATSERPPMGARHLARGWWARWKPAWMIKISGSGYRITFDIHRAFGLWTWLVVVIIAFTAFSLNLYREVFFPVMSTISKVTPTPFDVRSPRDRTHPIEAMVGRQTIVAEARAEALRRGWSEPTGAFAYDSRYGIASVLFFDPESEEPRGVAPAALYYDATSGALLGDKRPWQGTAADIFIQAQFPLHSGRILGLPGRILVSVMGLVVAALSVTGVLIWWRKRAGRLSRRRRARPGGRAVS